jgi:SET domain-containing protein
MGFMIKKNSKGKKGLFADRSFDTESLVLSFFGEKLSREQLLLLPQGEEDNSLQIGKDLFLNMNGENEYFINHSCNPNCYVKAIVNSAFLIALRPIAKDEELTFDYSLTSTDGVDDWSIDCSCHRFTCRKKISGFGSLPESKRKDLIENKVVPRYIVSLYGN